MSVVAPSFIKEVLLVDQKRWMEAEEVLFLQRVEEVVHHFLQEYLEEVKKYEQEVEVHSLVNLFYLDY